jgi:octaprenyl-diphosphate synthase
MKGFTTLYFPIREELKRLEEFLEKIFLTKFDFVNELLRELSNYRGKRIRPAILFFSAKLLGEISQQEIEFSAIIELMHNATLIHDDIIDDAKLRRNTKTLSLKMGGANSVIVGDYLFSKAFGLCLELNRREVTELISQTAQNMCLGELSQIAREFDYDLREDEYLGIIKLKTASLFKAAALLGVLCKDADKRFLEIMADFGQNFGMAFQIVDDCIDIIGDEQMTGKTLGTDIAKGKFTLPIIKTFSSASEEERKFLKEILSSDLELFEKRKIISDTAKKYDTIKYSLNLARSFIERAKSMLDEIEDNIYKKSLINLSEHILKI